MKKENYIVVQYWMVTNYNLTGNELLIYALIHGFNQDGETFFNGSIGYISEFLNISKRSVIEILKKLVDKKLIIKQELYINGVKFCKYKTFTTSEETSPPPSEETSPNNLASHSIEIYIPVLEKWNSLNIISHSKEVVKSKWQKKHTEQVKLYGQDKVFKAMENYATIIHGSSYFFDYKWPLWDFIARGLYKFLDEASPLENFKAKKIEAKNSSDPYKGIIL